jgi:hypothetical protein
VTTPIFLILASICTGSVIICTLWGHTTVTTRRDFVSLTQGFQLGAGEGVSAGVIVIAFFSLLAIPILKAERVPWNWQAVALIGLSVPALCGLCGGLGGFTAARTRLRPWSKQARHIAPKYFGPGSQHSFDWYLQQDSRVPVKSIGGICRWLRACRYTTDNERFHTLDYWQHPVEFERTREGDCEDHALWAWRKLIELGYPAEIIVGTSYCYNLQGEYHAWVVFTRREQRYLLEAADKRAPLIAPLREVQHLYVPDFGVDQQLHTYAYRSRVEMVRT